MSASAPQLLSRKAGGHFHGTLSRPSDLNNARQRGKTADETASAAKMVKGKGTADRRRASKNALESEAPSMPPPAAKSTRSKSNSGGEKLVIRRLPPGMTEQECVAILGPEWEVSRGKVDWLSYVPGKVSADLSKPSRPSRVYLNLVRKDDIMSLDHVVRKSVWEDAKSTFTNPSLLGPPTLEFSVFKKIGGTRRRTDARQGTIDQDPEFMAFLEGLANPPPMRQSIDVEDPNSPEKAETKITTTALVEYLKEKKANKGKDGSGRGTKAGKHRGVSKDDETTSSRKKGRDANGDKGTVKILTKKAATELAAIAAKKAATQVLSAAAPTTANTQIDVPKTRRSGIAAAARLLQRDLGLSPGSAHRRARHDAAKAEADVKDAGSSNKGEVGPATDADPTVAAVTDTADVAQAGLGNNAATRASGGRRSRGGRNADKGKGVTSEAPTAAPLTATNPPVILKKEAQQGDAGQKPIEARPAEQANGHDAVQATTNGSRQKTTEKSSGRQPSQKKQSQASSHAARAFVKHVNATQGVNDAALRKTLGAFGTITRVEIDKRKGFAYVDFADHEALAKAMAAGPIQIGQANVQVVERKDKRAASTPSGPSNATGHDGVANGEQEKGKEKPSSGGRSRRARGGGGRNASAATNSQPPAAAGKGATVRAGG